MPKGWHHTLYFRMPHPNWLKTDKNMMPHQHLPHFYIFLRMPGSYCGPDAAYKYATGSMPAMPIGKMCGISPDSDIFGIRSRPGALCFQTFSLEFL